MGADIVEAAGNPARQIDMAPDVLGRLALDENRNAPLMQVFRKSAQGFGDFGTMVLADQRDGLG